jgi:hypothetical protein
VTGDGHGSQPLGSQPFSLQPPESGCQLPMAEQPIPELPMPVPDTRHLALCLSLYSILHTQYSPVFYSTDPLSLRASNIRPLSPCQLASMSPRASACPHVTMPTCPLALMN